MVDHFFEDPLALRRLRTGPLGEHIDRFAALLSERGYARQTARVQTLESSLTLAGGAKSLGNGVLPKSGI